MNTVFVVMLMIFAHIVDDYYLQGWLASAKQKEWWKKNAPEQLYRFDYVWALIMHSLSWSFMIMLPLAYVYSFNVDVLFVVIFLENAFCHGVTDNLKANKRTINLWTDQLIHMAQIAITASILL